MPKEHRLLRKNRLHWVGQCLWLLHWGGHLGRKSDGPPGTQVLWRGIQRLDTATEMYAILSNQDPPHPQQSGP
jgi:hypothetical protein